MIRVCKNGIVCLVINSEVRETDKMTGKKLPAQFEVNLYTEELQTILRQVFCNWTILKEGVTEQQYDIPRECGTSNLQTNVVSFVARKSKINGGKTDDNNIFCATCSAQL